MLLPLLAALWLAPPAAAQDHPVKLIPGAVPDDRQPDGNTVIFEEDDGLVVVDTGRHLEHQGQILAWSYARKKPIAALVNTHWHLDHSGGNQELRFVYPGAKLYTSNAIRGALDGFLAKGLANGRKRIADPAISDFDKVDSRLGVGALEDRKDLIPDVPVAGDMKLGRLELHLAPSAATEGDVWLYDPESRTLAAGDLVVIPVPFFDTACPQGWRAALDRIAAQPFDTLIPGHGPTMRRADFLLYRAAFGRLLDCAASAATREACAEGWIADAAHLLTTDQERAYARAAVPYYFDYILRNPARQAEFCPAKKG